MTVVLFLFSVALSLSPQQLAEAKAQNLSILSYLANQYGYNRGPLPGYRRLSPLSPQIIFGHRYRLCECCATRFWRPPPHVEKPGMSSSDAVILGCLWCLPAGSSRTRTPVSSVHRMHQWSHRGNSAAVAYVRHSNYRVSPRRGKASNVFVTPDRSYHRICHFLRHVPITTIISEMLYESLSAD